jgi:TetR/AcrR family transcriptional repressor of mexJK operon
VYSYFPDKSALLKASFERNIAAIRLPELADKADLPTSVEALNAFGERLVSFLNRPEIVKAGDLMSVTAAEHPGLAAAFYAAGPEAVATMVVKFLRSLDARGLISIGDVDLAAEQLISAWLGVSQLKQSLGVAGPPSAEDISRKVRHATRIFMRAWLAPA